MEAAGADLITFHGRTRQQFYAPSSDNRVIAAVKQAVSVPVVGNGDLFTADDVRRMREETGCDGVMIARGAMGNPFLFSEILAMDEGLPFVPPTDKERLDTALAHAADMVMRKGARVGLAEARKHMLWYCKGLRGASTARDALTRAESLTDFSAVFATLLERNV
jgi:tRNA-dihydrouridine synthase